MPGSDANPAAERARPTDTLIAPEDRLSDAPNLRDALQQLEGNPAGDLAGDIVEYGPPVYIADPAGRLLQCNAAFGALCDRAKTESGSGGESDAARVPRFLSGVVARIGETGESITREEVFFGNGRGRLIGRHRPLRDQDGAIFAVGGVFTDAPEDDGPKDSADQISERFDDIARLVSDWIWETDSEFNLTFVSARVIEALGIHPRALIGRPIFSLGRFEAADTPASAGNIPNTETRRPFRNLGFEVVRSDGSRRLFDLSGIPKFTPDSGKFTGFRGTAKDITAERDALAHAEQARARLAEAIESISQGFTYHDADGRLALCNTRFREMFPAIADLAVPGTTFEEIVRAGVERRGLAIAEDEIEDRVQALLAEWRKPQCEFELHLADGRWFKVSGRRTADGGTVGVRTDITELKSRESALQAAKEIAETANDSKGAFLANMSHELRTPLNAIIGFAEIMAGGMFGPLGDDRYVGYTEDIGESARHLLAIINDILDVSKAEAGKLELQSEEVDVGRAINSAMRLVTTRARAADIALRTDFDASLPNLYADERKLKQILLNLLTNAIKFTPEGGTVEVSSRSDADGSLVIAVKDSGIGMSAEDIPKALAPFGQVDGRLSRKYEGTGLGLPLTKALIELHDGVMTLRSEPGNGTEVEIRFPNNLVVLP